MKFGIGTTINLHESFLRNQFLWFQTQKKNPKNVWKLVLLSDSVGVEAIIANRLYKVRRFWNHPVFDRLGFLQVPPINLRATETECGESQSSITGSNVFGDNECV